jgi:hypothetical protein
MTGRSMRTELAALTALAALVALVGPSAADDGAERGELAQRFTLGLPAEVTLVGLTYGARPEVLYRFGERGSRSRIRLAVGLLDGPEQLFVPISLGYRAIFRQDGVVRPSVGAGVEMQQRFVPDYMTVRQYGVYVEGGLEIAFAPKWSVGTIVALDVMVAGGKGAGLGPRLFVTREL